MMKLTYKDLIMKHAGLLSVGKKILPRKATVAIKRNLLKMEEELKVLNDQRKDIIDRYVCKDVDGNPVIADQEYTFNNKEDCEAFKQEMTELEETEIEIDLLKFSVSELDKCESNERYDILTPVEEASIDWMLNN